MTGATLGYGVKLKLGDNASPTETFAEIGEIVDLSDGDSAELKEATNHQSPNRRREYIGGLIDGGEITFTVNYIPNNATHNLATGLKGLIGLTRNFRLEEPGNPTGVQFAAVIMSRSNPYPVDDKMTMDVTLKKTSAESTYTIS